MADARPFKISLMYLKSSDKVSDLFCMKQWNIKLLEDKFVLTKYI